MSTPVWAPDSGQKIRNNRICLNVTDPSPVRVLGGVYGTVGKNARSLRLQCGLLTHLFHSFATRQLAWSFKDIIQADHVTHEALRVASSALSKTSYRGHRAPPAFSHAASTWLKAPVPAASEFPHVTLSLPRRLSLNYLQGWLRLHPASPESSSWATPPRAPPNHLSKGSLPASLLPLPLFTFFTLTNI